MKKTKGPFRKALADFIRGQREYRSNKEVKKMIYPFCCGWWALSDQMDEVLIKYKTEEFKEAHKQ